MIQQGDFSLLRMEVIERTTSHGRNWVLEVRALAYSATYLLDEGQAADTIKKAAEDFFANYPGRMAWVLSNYKSEEHEAA